MANPIIVPKKSTVADKVPTTSDLALGEIAINHADKKLYARHPTTGVVQEIGNLSAHSHDQLISLDSTADLELQNDGSVVITDGSIATTLTPSSTSSRTITLPDKSGTVALLDDISGGSSPTIGTSASDVLSITAGEIIADDAGADKLVFWDDSESKLTHLSIGSGISISGTTLSAAITSDPTGVTGADAITNIMSLTQAEYDAIATPNASTLYIITD